MQSTHSSIKRGQMVIRDVKNNTGISDCIWLYGQGVRRGMEVYELPLLLPPTPLVSHGRRLATIEHPGRCRGR